MVLILFLIAYFYLFNRIRLNKILTFSFILITTIAITSIAVISFHTAKNSLEMESFNKLTAVREIKEQLLQTYFESVENQIITFSQSKMIIEAMREFYRGGVHEYRTRY